MESVGLDKAHAPTTTTLALAVVAGVYISLGAAFSTAAMASTGLFVYLRGQG
ncbi:formate/nitrite transporter family protein [Egibacter rhizosphaerae]|uniref:formate/nitrite transporter family protein n=1 Tax=Egibacter rhizosphaerae TaxID=1670831 RepID=UPI0013F148DB|nr:formate/nitrite transporter family protein [Egibacter rhizosphaerae]